MAGRRLERRLADLLQATRDIDRRFLDKVGRFPVEIVSAMTKSPFPRAAHSPAARGGIANPSRRRPRPRLRFAMHTAFQEEFARLQHELFRLYAEEVRSLSRSVRLPGPLVPLREMIARELLTSCCGSPGRWRAKSRTFAWRDAPAGPTSRPGMTRPPD
jgi:hypothetical protein